MMRSIHDPSHDLDIPITRIPAIPYVTEGASARRFGPQVEAVTGHPTAAFIQDSDLWRRLIHPDDVASVERVAVGDAHRSVSYRVMTTEGTYRWFRDDSDAIGDVDGTGRVGVLIDITEERATEEVLQERIAKFRALVEQMPAVVYLHGPGARPANIPEFMSRRYEEVFGYPIEERMADPDLWSKILHPDDRERALVIARHAAATGEPFSMDYRIVRGNGSVAWIHDETVLVRDDGGDPLFWQGVATDITERKRTEDALREAAAKFQTLAEQIPAVTYIEQLGETAKPLYMS